MNCSTPGLPVYHQFLEPTQTHVNWVGHAIQPSHPLSSPFPPAFNHSQQQGFFKWVSSNCSLLTCIQISQEAGQMVCYSHLLKNFLQFVVIHTVKGFSIVNKAEVDVFLELSHFFNDPKDVGNLISGSSAFSEFSLNIWNSTVHVLLNPGLENSEHYFASMWDEWNSVVVWTIFVIAFLWDWNENWPSPVLWSLLSFPNLLSYWMQHFHSIFL